MKFLNGLHRPVLPPLRLGPAEPRSRRIELTNSAGSSWTASYALVGSLALPPSRLACVVHIHRDPAKRYLRGHGLTDALVGTDLRPARRREGQFEELKADSGSRRRSSVIRRLTIAALFHPARHCRLRHGRRLGSRSDSLGRRRRRLGRDSLGRSRGRNRGRELEARQMLENALEIADPHRMLLHHGRQGSGELIDFPRSNTT